MRRAFLILLLTASFTPAAALAAAPSSDFIGNKDGTQGFDISTMFFAFPPGFIGLSINVGFPILPGGTVGVTKKLNDAVYLEADLNLGTLPAGTIQNPIVNIYVGARYQLHLYEWFTIYIAGRVGVAMSNPGGVKGNWTAAFGAMGGPGMHFHLNERIAIKVEGGWPPIRVGVAFLL